MDIPDEIESLLSRRLPDSFIQEEHESLRRELAPLLADQARAAQVAVLRELLGVDNPNFPPTSAADLVMLFINKLRALEAGANA